MIRNQKAEKDIEAIEQPQEPTDSRQINQEKEEEVIPTKSKVTEGVIKCPFIFLVPKVGDQVASFKSPKHEPGGIMVGKQLNAATNTNRNCLCIKSKEEVKIFGDLDILIQMNMQHVSEDFIAKYLPKELHRFICQEPFAPMTAERDQET